MILIESYLSEVGRHLPAGQRSDILRELRASLEEQVLDAAGDSRPDLEAEKSVINRFGHPLKVASSFLGQRYLIGPELFPTFVVASKIVLIVVALIQVGLMFTAFVASGWTTSPLQLVASMFATLLWAAAVTVGVFAAIEYSGERLNWYESWTADSLSLSTGTATKHGDLISNLITEAVFLLWWNNVLALQNWIPGATDAFSVTLTDTWATLYWPVNILFGAWLVLHATVLIRGLWSRAANYTELALGAITIAMAAWLLLHSPLVSVSGALAEKGEAIAGRVVVSIIVFVIGITAWDMFAAVRRLRQGRLEQG